MSISAEKFEARLPERFWSKVDKQADGCWLWTAADRGNGYGLFTIRRRNISAHRYAYELLVGPIPDGLVLDHVIERGCTSSMCVNPAHLEPVPQRETVMRGTGVTAVHAQKTHCIHGHPFEGDNLVLRSGGGRQCRECDRKKAREYQRRKRSAA